VEPGQDQELVAGRERGGGAHRLGAQLDPHIGRALVALHGRELAVTEVRAHDADGAEQEVGRGHDWAPKSAFSSA